MSKLTANMVAALKSARYIKSDTDRKIIAEDDSFESFTGWAIIGMDGRTRAAMHKRGLMHGHYYLTAEGVDAARTVRDDIPEKAEAFCAMHNTGISQCADKHNNDSDAGFQETESIPAKKSGFPIATQNDTNNHFMGSSATVWEWWDNMEYTYEDKNSSEVTSWQYKGIAGTEDDYDVVVILNHTAIVRTIRKISRLALTTEPKDRGYVSDVVIRECRTWVFKGPDECDFDAAMADEVMQYAAFGSVVYA